MTRHVERCVKALEDRHIGIQHNINVHVFVMNDILYKYPQVLDAVEREMLSY